MAVRRAENLDGHQFARGEKGELAYPGRRNVALQQQVEDDIFWACPMSVPKPAP